MNRKSLSIKTNLLLLACLLGFVSRASAQQSKTVASVPRLVRFSGTFHSPSPVPAGIVGGYFAIYGQQEDGVPLWTEQQNVQLDADGNYTVLLGATKDEGVPVDLFSDGASRWLEVKLYLPNEVDLPRVLLVSVPYALKAGDAATLGGLPASAFILAGSAAPVQSAVADSADLGGPVAAISGVAHDPTSLNMPSCVAGHVNGVGMAGSIPMWTGSPNTCSIVLGQSNFFQDSSGNLGFMGPLQLTAQGTAAASGGFDSQPFDLFASAFNSATKAPVSEHFRWQTEPVGNDTSAPSAMLDLLFGSGSGTPAETGLSISSAGLITFTPAQTFPGTGGVTSVGSGTGLTGGPITTSGTLSVDTTVIATQTFANSAASAAQGNADSYANNTFLPLAGGTLTGNLKGTTASFTGALTAAGVNSTNPYQISGANVLSVDGSQNVFVGSPEPAGNTGIQNTASGAGALIHNTAGLQNTAIGYIALANNTTGNNNTAIGVDVLAGNTTGSANTASGESALNHNTTGTQNTAVGNAALASNSTGSSNTAIGLAAGYSLGASNSAGGSSNIMVGVGAGSNFNANESNNIDIGNAGVAGDPGVIRIGTAGSQTKTVIAGIMGVTPGANPLPVVIDSNGQLGTGAAVAGTVTSVASGMGLTGGPITTSGTLSVDTTVIATQTFANSAASAAQTNAESYANSTFLPLAGGTLTGNLKGTTASFTGALTAAGVNSTNPYQIAGANVLSVDGSQNVFVGSPEPAGNTGNQNTASGVNALVQNTTGLQNTAVGALALFANTQGNNNTAVGVEVLASNTTGKANTGSGEGALFKNTTGTQNTAVGNDALLSNSTGSNNTAIGLNAGGNLGSSNSAGGSSNIMVGIGAGSNFNANESNNIDIGHGGTAGESGVIRIGTAGTHTATYIAGVSSVTTGGAATTVVIDGNGNLGTISSSRRYKEDIHDMGTASDGLLRLRPVTFRYKKPYTDGSKPIQYGLIAEEVAAVYPDMVVRGKDGQVETVQYYKLDAMLLNEVQKQAKAHTADQERIAELEAQTEQLRSQVAKEKKQGQEQQAALRQLLAQMQGIQVKLAGGPSARPHRRVSRASAHKTVKSGGQHSQQAGLSMAGRATAGAAEEQRRKST